jgi:CO/xanthine dehydrogenase FAD-binding subunit
MTGFKYLKPESVESAIELMGRGEPLAGGSWLAANREGLEAVVDLSHLGLDQLTESKGQVIIGATVSLQRVLQFTQIDALQHAIRLEIGWNMRNQVAIAGALVACDGRSPLAVTLLALDAKLRLVPDDDEMSLDQFLDERHKGGWGTFAVEIQFRTPAAVVYHQVARAPRDRPIVSVSVVKTKDDDIQIGLGGYGARPTRLLAAEKAMKSTAKLEEIADQARINFQDAGDVWASAAYRSEVAATLLLRALQEVN